MNQWSSFAVDNVAAAASEGRQVDCLSGWHHVIAAFQQLVKELIGKLKTIFLA